MIGQLDHPALEQALQAQDCDSIRRLFLYERDLRIRAETTLDGMQEIKIKSLAEQQAQPQTQIPQTKPKPKTNNAKQTSLSLEELGL